MHNKIKNIVYTALIISLSFCGCRNDATIQMPTNESTLLDIDSNIDKYDIYETGFDGSVFNSAINLNNIDVLYNEEISEAYTISEMVEIEIKYISIWRNELYSSAAKYEAMLTEKDKESFQKAQASFEEYLENSFNYDSEILLYDHYGIHMGTSSKWLLYVEMRNTIRDRTIHVKYLHYLLERVTGDESNYTSIMFSTEVG